MNEKTLCRSAQAMAMEIFVVVSPLLQGWERQAAYEEFYRICKEYLEQVKPINLEPSRN